MAVVASFQVLFLGLGCMAYEGSGCGLRCVETRPNVQGGCLAFRANFNGSELNYKYLQLAGQLPRTHRPMAGRTAGVYQGVSPGRPRGHP